MKKQTYSNTPVSVVILAAGKGTRMKSDKPKVLHKVGHLPMLFHVSNAAQILNPTNTIAVIGHGSETVEKSCAEYNQDLTCVLQKEQLGTGHAVLQTKKTLSGFEGDIAILTGDCPLMTSDMLSLLVQTHQEQGFDITFLSTTVEDPEGLGRVTRNSQGNVTGVVEHKDADEATRNIKEINTGIYVVKSTVLFTLLADVKNDNAQGEYYLPDIIPLALAQDLSVGTARTEDGDALLGINSRAQLAFAESVFQKRKRAEIMGGGVTLQAPETVYFSWDTTIEQETFVGPNVRFMQGVHIEKNCTIEGSCYLKNCTIEQGATLLPFCYIDDANIAAGRTTEPFTCIAPDANTLKKLTSIN
jgi:bifunctional UDP-N-acetylglucosamine pyrophosphorylase/glucosamine-1-phosphate N-acetyltransferase